MAGPAGGVRKRAGTGANAYSYASPPGRGGTGPGPFSKHRPTRPGPVWCIYLRCPSRDLDSCTCASFRSRNRASGPEIADCLGFKRPPLTAKPVGKGGGLRPPTFSNKFCAGRRPSRPPESTISGPEALLSNLNYSLGGCCTDPRLMLTRGLGGGAESLSA